MKKDGNIFSLEHPFPIPTAAASSGPLPLCTPILLEEGPLNKAFQQITCKKKFLTNELSWGLSPCLLGNCELLKGKQILFKRESRSLGFSLTTVFVSWLWYPLRIYMSLSIAWAGLGRSSHTHSACRILKHGVRQIPVCWKKGCNSKSTPLFLGQNTRVHGLNVRETKLSPKWQIVRTQKGTHILSKCTLMHSGYYTWFPLSSLCLEKIHGYPTWFGSWGSSVGLSFLLGQCSAEGQRFVIPALCTHSNSCWQCVTVTTGKATGNVVRLFYKEWGK